MKRFGIHPNAYYNYLKETKKAFNAQKAEICAQIRELYHETNGTAGHREIQVFLRNKGIRLSKTTVHKYMNREMRLMSICRRKKPGYRKCHPHKLFPNLLNRNFNVEAKNTVWCTDFTYLYLANGTVRYNCSIIDLYDRSIVASKNGRFITSDLAIETVRKALRATGCNPAKLTLHSDQGSQFTSMEFIDFCEGLGIQQSMSKAGCPYDNAPMERYYNTLKNELVYLYQFDTVAELDYAVSEFAYRWYNQIRPHSHNGYMTPYEKRFN